MARDDHTTIALTKATRDRLKDLGTKGETYEEILIRLLDAYESGGEVTVTVRERRAGETTLEMVPFEELPPDDDAGTARK